MQAPVSYWPTPGQPPSEVGRGATLSENLAILSVVGEESGVARAGAEVTI